MGRAQENLAVLRKHLAELESLDHAQHIADAVRWAVHRLDPDLKVGGKKKPSKTYREESFYYQAANRLRKWIEHNNPVAQRSEDDVQRWAKYFERLENKIGESTDNRKLIIMTLDWCQRDDFWQSNILSGKKFYEKFEKLSLKMRNDRNGRSNGRTDGQARRDATERIQQRINESKKEGPDSAF